MTLIFNKEFAINPQSSQSSGGGGGSTSGLPKDAIILYVYNQDIGDYTSLCTYADVSDIHPDSENAYLWIGTYNGQNVIFSYESDTETGEQLTKIYYGENWDEVIIRFSGEYFQEKYPEQQ